VPSRSLMYCRSSSSYFSGKSNRNTCNINAFCHVTWLRFEVLTAVKTSMVAVSSLLCGDGRFGQKYCTSTLKVKAIRYSETSVTTYKTTRHYDPEDLNWLRLSPWQKYEASIIRQSGNATGVMSLRHCVCNESLR
jgi:hypothetical protein